MTKLIVGLGNIGQQYSGTRHNIGFYMADTLAKKWGSSWHEKPKFKAAVAEVVVDGQKVILLKPHTFYNLSGEAVRAAKDFYKLQNTDILAIHDELALPFGTIRVRTDGSDAGNNGIKSLNQHLGSDYPRIRIGIAGEQATRADAADFVLSRLTNDESAHLPEIFDHTLQLVMQFIDEANTFQATSVRTSRLK